MALLGYIASCAKNLYHMPFSNQNLSIIIMLDKKIYRQILVATWHVVEVMECINIIIDFPIRTTNKKYYS